MSLFIRLSTVAAIAVLLRCVPATVDITAPSTITGSIAGLETREQGPTAWICSVLAVDSPWTSYANIRGYLEGGNAEKKDYSNFVLYPVMELYHASESRLCVYLPAEDHCYPPAPSTNQVKAVKQLSKRNYYAIRFWGQASNARVQYYKQKLTAALNTQNKAANFDLFFVSFFSDHVREVRYDPATTGQGKSAEPLQKPQSQGFTCPTAPDYTISSNTTQLDGQEFLKTTLFNTRLSLSDVETIRVPFEQLQNQTNQNPCVTAAMKSGVNAFSMESGQCKLYNFRNNFCPCAPGNFTIYINPKMLGAPKELLGEQLTAGVTAMVIYSETPLIGTLYLSNRFDSVKDSKACAAHLSASSFASGAFFVNNKCYMSLNHDFVNCQRTCRGQPVDVLVKTVDPFPKTPILSLCGKNIVIPMIAASDRPAKSYTSQAGFGCYSYQGEKTAAEDCIVRFEKSPKAKGLRMMVSVVRLISQETTCLDELSIYNGTEPVENSLIFRGCSEYVTASVPAITVKFRRGPVSEKNFGFKLDIGSDS